MGSFPTVEERGKTAPHRFTVAKRVGKQNEEIHHERGAVRRSVPVTGDRLVVKSSQELYRFFTGVGGGWLDLVGFGWTGFD